MGFAGAAQQALAASHVHFGGNEIAFLDAGDLIAKGCDLPAEFVPRDERWMNAVLRPAVPLVNVQVGAADRRNLHSYQNVVASECGNLDFSNLSTGCCFCLYYRKHCVRHEPAL